MPPNLIDCMEPSFSEYSHLGLTHINCYEKMGKKEEEKKKKKKKEEEEEEEKNE